MLLDMRGSSRAVQVSCITLKLTSTYLVRSLAHKCCSDCSAMNCERGRDRNGEGQAFSAGRTSRVLLVSLPTSTSPLSSTSQHQDEADDSLSLFTSKLVSLFGSTTAAHVAGSFRECCSASPHSSAPTHLPSTPPIDPRCACFRSSLARCPSLGRLLLSVTYKKLESESAALYQALERS